MNTRSMRSFVFLFLAALLTFSVAFAIHDPTHRLVFDLLSLVPIFGAVTTTYLYPTNLGPLVGGNVAPTQTQMGPETAAKFNTVIATVSASAAGDTSAVITHNFQLTAGEISQGFPRTVLEFLTDATSSPWFVASQNPNYTVIQKNTLNAGPTVEVIIDRPHTLTR